MKPERTIQSLFDQFPSVFHNRREVLDYLFFSRRGNIGWVGGEIVDLTHIVDIDYDRMSFEVKAGYKPADEGIPDIKKAKPIKIVRTKNHIWRYDPNDSEQCKRALYYHIPDDVTPEWKKLVGELEKMMLKDGINIRTKEITPEGELHLERHYKNF